MKKLWKQNRILFVLIIILIVCFVAIISVALTFFYSKNVSKYGDRLDNIEDYPIEDNFKTEYKETLMDNKNVTKVSMNLIGRVLYINIDFDDQIKLENAQKIITNSLDLFDEDTLNYYDVQFILKSDNFTIIGAKNAVVENIVWNNNTEVKTDEE